MWLRFPLYNRAIPVLVPPGSALSARINRFLELCACPLQVGSVWLRKVSSFFRRDSGFSVTQALRACPRRRVERFLRLCVRPFFV